MTRVAVGGYRSAGRLPKDGDRPREGALLAGVRVVIDSACDLPEELAQRYGIVVVPLTIRFGDEEFVDRVDLKPDEFWRRCKASPTLPETAAPAPGAFRAAFEAAADDGADGVLCLTISAEMSATGQAAAAGAETVRDRVPVEIVDTRSVTMGEGLIGIAAAQCASKGATLAEVAAHARGLVGRTTVLGVVDTLEHLQRGGRIGGAAALVGSLLSIKPVIQVRDGVVQQESRQRTRSRALDYLLAKVASDAPLSRLAVCNGAAPDIDSVLARLSSVPVAEDPVVTDLGPVVGTHAGPGAIGICYQLP